MLNPITRRPIRSAVDFGLTYEIKIPKENSIPPLIRIPKSVSSLRGLNTSYQEEYNY